MASFSSSEPSIMVGLDGGTGWYRMVQGDTGLDGAGWHRLVQDGTGKYMIGWYGSWNAPQ